MLFMEPSQSLLAQIMQFAPLVQGVMQRIRPFFDSPIVRLPYNFPLATSQSIAAGGVAVPLTAADFTNGLEYPFEVHKIKFSNDPAHSFRDWRVSFQDLTFQQPFQKATTSMVATLVNDNTGAWEQLFPWVVRNKGGGINIGVTNLDTDNPITVDIALVGYLLIPRATYVNALRAHS
jgi:hypothetical protein